MYIYRFNLVKNENMKPFKNVIDCRLEQFSTECRRTKTITFTYQLRNRKHALCFYRVIETRVEVWENEKCCGNTSRRQLFPQLFWVLPNFHECFYNSIETRKTFFLFLLENTTTKKRKTACLLRSSKCKFSLLTPSLRQQLELVLCFHQVIETGFLTNQRAYFCRTVF